MQSDGAVDQVPDRGSIGHNRTRTAEEEAGAEESNDPLRYEHRNKNTYDPPLQIAREYDEYYANRATNQLPAGVDLEVINRHQQRTAVLRPNHEWHRQEPDSDRAKRKAPGKAALTSSI